MEILRLLGQWAKPSQVDQSIGLWDPLPEREVSAAAIEPALPALLSDNEALLAPTLEMVEKLKLSKKSLSAEVLLRIAMTSALPDPARAAALELWLDENPQDTLAVLFPLVSGKSDALAKAALASLAKLHPEKAIEGIAIALKSPGNARRQAA